LLEFRVYLPPCYEEGGEGRYPVLYLIHGQSNTDAQWDRIGVDDKADEVIRAGELSPFLIVMPRDRVWTSPDEDMFGQAVVEELIPWVDDHYPTLTAREYRAVGGLSRGASWAVHLGLKHWELFGIIGAHSLPVFAVDVGRVSGWLDEIPLDSYPRIFIDVGTRDFENIVESSTWFENLLTEKSIPHEWYLFAGFHDEAYWRSHLEQYLLFYAAEW
jgi:enterochelin esterase-like enzyme